MRACATLKESHRKLFGFAGFALALVLSLASMPVNAAEIYGRITLPDGKTPAANKPISVAGRLRDLPGLHRLGAKRF